MDELVTPPSSSLFNASLRHRLETGARKSNTWKLSLAPTFLPSTDPTQSPSPKPRLKPPDTPTYEPSALSTPIPTHEPLSVPTHSLHLSAKAADLTVLIPTTTGRTQEPSTAPISSHTTKTPQTKTATLIPASTPTNKSSASSQSLPLMPSFPMIETTSSSGPLFLILSNSAGPAEPAQSPSIKRRTEKALVEPITALVTKIRLAEITTVRPTKNHQFIKSFPHTESPSFSVSPSWK